MNTLNVVESIFFAALEKRTSEARVAYLAEACGGDDQLRLCVERLLDAHSRADRVIPAQAPGLPDAVEPAGPGAPIQERPGAIIGPYKLLQELGEGGMGTVFLAEQTEPVRRKVALKIIKAGLDSAQVIARFEVERQALALMDHPNIAKVLDAGTTDSGRPFFVMELVKGASLTTYCDENRLTPRQRLELFIPVCQAIQHAHQNGIIHRDIKPSNVLVAIYDGKPVPKVIDFGIAKATDQSLTEKTLFTRHGQIIGTFEYMSPEQATLDALDVDTRSDIYSLGVLLYELLTGTTPLDKERLRQAAFLEALRLIREEEPPRPSSRLSESRGALVAASLQRQTDADKLPGLVAGELDWIVMKSLDKDRTRRYATAGGLALDVAHYLRDEQVEACPPTAGYRLRKFVRRHRGPVLTAALVLVAVLAGIVGTSWGWVEALGQRDDAVHARRKEEEQRRLALASAAEAKSNEHKAKEAGDEAQRLAKEEKASRKLADEQRLKALSEKEQADLARQKAKDSETKAERRLYAMQIASAQREWETNNIHLLHHYLDQCRRDFRGWEHDYLYTLANRYQHLLPGAGESLLSGGMAFSADGTRLALGSVRPQKVQVWDLDSCKEVLTLKDIGSCVALSPDGKRLASAWYDKEKREVPPGGLFSFPLDGRVKVWDAVTGKEIFSLPGHPSHRPFVAFSPDGKRLASSSLNGRINLWDMETGKELGMFKHSDIDELKLVKQSDRGVFASAAFSADGKQLAGVDVRQGVTVWDVASGKELIHHKGHKGEVLRIAFSPDGKHLATASRARTLKVWELPGGREVLKLQESANYFAFSPDGKRLVGGGGRDKGLDGFDSSGVVKVWDFPSGRELFTVKGPRGQLAFSPDGKRLASYDSGEVKIWDLAASQDGLTFKSYEGFARALVFSPDSKQLFAGVANGNTLKLWDVAGGREIRTFEGHTNLVMRAAFSPDGTRLATPSLDFTVKLWDVASGKEIRTFTDHTQDVRVSFSPDGKYLASSEMSGGLRVRVWDVNTGKQILSTTGTGGPLVFSPDSKSLATTERAFRSQATTFGKVKVYDVLSGRQIMKGEGHTRFADGLAFSPDGTRLASASDDKTVRVWDVAGGRELMTLWGHTSGVTSVAFSPDGKRLASGSHDKTVKLWDMDSGQEVLTLKGHADTPWHLTFSPDGKRLASASLKAIIVWDASKSMPEPGPK